MILIQVYIRASNISSHSNGQEIDSMPLSRGLNREEPQNQ